MEKKTFIGMVLVACFVSGLLVYAHASAPTVTGTPLTLSWVGDMVPTEDDSYNALAFQNVQSFITSTDIALGNFEGTLAAPNRVSKCAQPTATCFAFRGTTSFAQALTSAGFDFVNLANNHAFDFYKDGLVDTQQTLQSVGLHYISPLQQTEEITVKGLHIGFLGVTSSAIGHPLTDYTYIKNTVSDLKTRNDFVVVLFHGGAEGPDKTAVTGEEEYQGDEDRGNVELLAHIAVDAGADVVLGSGPHVLRKIEYYKDSLIAYSLGNFEGGNGKLNTTGILGDSGILTVVLSTGEKPAYRLSPVHLSVSGIPTLQ